ncbi:Cytochrome c-type biogenesis protein CcmE, heme chaperone [Rhodovulum sp. PH10]|uniref:cytochrome c maturation protein CcmE n=1 Tax=Rhodovulum sp. PH10 TaxID=1187851 RepID=UPI00027C26F0|nr:Cytochrome c-type biogenesis protein CcmE, heme chaperone [Rhodovulum sp. PH10]
MTRKQRRFTLIAGGVAVLAVAVGLILHALDDNIAFFTSPTELSEKPVGPGTRLRIGGLVQPGSVVRPTKLDVRFEVTDGNKAVPVTYTGILPDLFREGQGVVAEGMMEPGGVFKADTVLAKHDEKYMPREVADALKKQGHWQTDYDKAGAKAPAGSPASPAAGSPAAPGAAPGASSALPAPVGTAVAGATR